MKEGVSFGQQALEALDEKVEPKFVGPLVFLSFLSIFICCVSSTHCVRTARDCKIALNAMNIRRQYQRNMQLYCLMKEKMLIEASRRMKEYSLTNSSERQYLQGTPSPDVVNPHHNITIDSGEVLQFST